MSNRIFEKLNKINSKDEFMFKLELNGKVIHEISVEVPEYAKGIIEDEDLKLYYFFKDMANKLEEKIIEVHKAKAWEEKKEEEDDNTNGK